MSQLPASGVKRTSTPWAHNQRSSAGVWCPVRLSQLKSTRKRGSSAGKGDAHPQPRLPAGPTGPVGHRIGDRLGLRQLGEQRTHRPLEPGLQAAIGAGGHPLGPDTPGGRPQQGQQLRGAQAYILVGLLGWMPDRRPLRPGVRQGLIRPGFLLAGHRYP
ncbi:MAG TPA: hypothetical protein VGS80_01725 [Ktedonobacterales bacterium]|nr:hypothetical protein [Ktedonobacterales bacterium]